MDKFSKSQAAFGASFRVPGGYLKAGTNSLNSVTGRIFLEFFF
jgi:hypothetical protein